MKVGSKVLVGITSASWGYHMYGVAGAVLLPFTALVVLEVADLLMTLVMVRRYYWHNERRSRWNAFCYLKGWTQ